MAKIVRKKTTNKNQLDPRDKTIQELQASQQALLEQVTLLQEQLQQRKLNDEDLELESQAAKIQQEQAKLREEADLRKLLSDATQPSRIGVDSVDEISQKDMIDILAGTVGKALDAQSKLMETRTNQLVSGLTQRLDGTQKVIMEMMAGMQVNKAQEKFKDFGEYTKDIKKILMENPNMSPERAYILAKAEKSLTTPAQQQTETERPINAPTYFPTTEEEEELQVEEPEEGVRIDPRKAFRESAMKAIDKVIAARQNATQ